MINLINFIYLQVFIIQVIKQLKVVQKDIAADTSKEAESKERLAELSIKNCSMEAEIGGLKKRIKSLTGINLNVEATSKELEDKMSRLTEQLSIAKENALKSDEELLTKDIRIQELNQGIQNLEEEFSQQSSAKNQTIKDLKSKTDELTSQLSAVQVIFKKYMPTVKSYTTT